MTGRAKGRGCWVAESALEPDLGGGYTGQEDVKTLQALHLDLGIVPHVHYTLMMTVVILMMVMTKRRRRM